MKIQFTMVEVVVEIPNNDEQKTAQECVRALCNKSENLINEQSAYVGIKFQNDDEFVSVPQKAFLLLIDILSIMAEGKSIKLISSDSYISTQQAADILNVSRPHIVKLLESGVIPFKKVGAHRRVELKDLVQFQKNIQEVKENNLAFLAQQAQELTLGY